MSCPTFLTPRRASPAATGARMPASGSGVASEMEGGAVIVTCHLATRSPCAPPPFSTFSLKPCQASVRYYYNQTNCSLQSAEFADSGGSATDQKVNKNHQIPSTDQTLTPCTRIP